MTVVPYEPEEDQPDQTSVVDLVKHGPDDEPGAELEVAPERLPVLVRGRVLATRAKEGAGNAKAAVLLKGVAIIDHPHTRRRATMVVKSPIAAAKIVGYSPRGLHVQVKRMIDWTRDAGSEEMGRKAVDRDDIEGWAKVVAGREKRNLESRKWTVGIIAGLVTIVALAWFVRPAFSGLFAVGLFALLAWFLPKRHTDEALWALGISGGVGALAYFWLGPWIADHIPQPDWTSWMTWLSFAPIVAWLGWSGRPDGSLVGLPARMASTKAPEITSYMVIQALTGMGNAKMKDPDAFRVLMDPHRVGEGVQLDIELPPGVTATWVMENRETLAANTRRKLGTVWPGVGDAHPGHLSLYISYTPMNEMPQDPWPLLTKRTIDIFDPQPVFTDQLGKWVYITLAYASWVIGAVPRMGKTFSLRQLLLTFGMDPRVRVIAWDGKGTGDLSPLASWLHQHIRGARVDVIENIMNALDTVRELAIEMGKRADFLAGLPFDEAPESKVTSDLVDKYPQLAPIVLGIDETQAFFGFGYRKDKDHKAIRDEIRDLVIELMRLGPALGIWVVMATQTVRDSTIPTEASAVAVYRLAFKLEGYEPNDRVLGTGARKAGIDATMFAFEEKGIGWVKGEGNKPFIGRSVVGLDAVAARIISARIRQARDALGLLTGEAAGQEDVIEGEIVYDIVQDTAIVMRQHNVGRAHWVMLVPWLKELRPQVYADLNVDGLSAAIRETGVERRQFKVDGVNNKGVRLSDLGKQDSSDTDDFADTSDTE